MSVDGFQDKYPTREEKEEAVKKLTDEELDEIIASCNSVQAKAYYCRLKMINQSRRKTDDPPVIVGQKSRRT